MKQKDTSLYFILMQGLILLFSFSSVMLKFAAGYKFLSLPFIFLYGAGMGAIFVYAIFWQIILKHVDLSVAYSLKSLTSFWTLVFSALIFKEKITISMVVGVALIVFGVFLVSTDAVKKEKPRVR